MAIEHIKVVKANVHNLKKISVQIPKNSICVITGPSGSGKSSLAFDTIYSEGQRRYIESLSSYARQFLGQFTPPDVESISGLSPAIAIDQKSTVNNPRSTVGTITEIYDYMRVLYARIGEPHCPETGEKVEAQTAQQMVNTLLKLPKKSKLTILSPIVKNKKGTHRDLLQRYLVMGFSKIRLGRKIIPLEDNVKIDKNKYHHIDLVIDRIIHKDGIKGRLTESVELALKLGNGHLVVITNDNELFFSEKNYSAKIDRSYPDLEPRLFSFNSPLGACSNCNGLGILRQFTPSSLFSSPQKSLSEGACSYLLRNSFLFNMVKCIAKAEKIDIERPFQSLPKKFKKILLEGSKKEYSYSFESENSVFRFKKKFPGLGAWLEKKYKETSSDKIRSKLESYMDIGICPECLGKRLSPFSLAVLINKMNIADVAGLPIDQCLKFFKSLSPKLKGDKKKIAEKLLKEIVDRLTFLKNVGLSYLCLDRGANTLSGGESQRIRLATQIGSSLSGVLYVLDEPSIGLHQRDQIRLIKTLKNLRDLGNTVLVVEHDEETIRTSDYIVDVGPKAGVYGGEIVAKGPLSTILKNKKSLTAAYLNGSLSIPVPPKRRIPNGYLSLKGAKDNNLKSIDISIPLTCLTCVTGVSGSGKSTLVHNILVPAVKNALKTSHGIPHLGSYRSLDGIEHIQSLIELDQTPIGRTPKSNPATYSGAFDLIRALFSSLPESKAKGYGPGRFSFNVKNGRCGSCEGNGVLKIEMHFLPDVFITCSQCEGRRYNDETLGIRYKGKSISEVLDMDVHEAVEFFSNHKKIHRILSTLEDVGLGYIALGQSSTTLSGGEAQRLKLAKELSKSTRGKTLYVLDEPTTGLHFVDIHVLLTSINRLIELGHTVVIIEHNLDVIKTADHIIDLGPEGGEKGGNVLFSGPPEKMLSCKSSHTAKFLKKYL
ncbi:MAG: excinuclease ABC subunit UvrA [Bacteriovoracales bacterium]|nr:excinuclease ABC subunit UvrA [Bacteriovoracales bacterium]